MNIILLNNRSITFSGKLKDLLNLPESNLFKGHPTRHHNEDMF